MVKVIGIGFLGLGVIGSGLLSMLQEQEQYLQEKYRVRFEVKAILVRDINKKRNVNIQKLLLTTDAKEIVENPEIQICLECMGGEGVDKTRDLILAAIENKKHVVMSSKKCLALYVDEIIAAATRNSVQLRVEATVGGAIPICRALMQMSGGDEITKIYGIVNGTSNYILSEIENANRSYQEALCEAKRMGYTENDPSEDVDGWDAAYKMRILLRLGMNLNVDASKLQPETIRDIDIRFHDKRDGGNNTDNINIGNNDSKDNKDKKDRIDKRNKKGKESCTKQLIYAKKTSCNEIEYFIGCVEVERENLLSMVKDNYNMILLEGKHSGTRAFYGRGAGDEATASVMFDDLMDTVFGNYQFKPAVTAAMKSIPHDQVEL
jgi:homoserine dehydrogenase